MFGRTEEQKGGQVPQPGLVADHGDIVTRQLAQQGAARWLREILELHRPVADWRKKLGGLAGPDPGAVVHPLELEPEVFKTIHFIFKARPALRRKRSGVVKAALPSRDGRGVPDQEKVHQGSVAKATRTKRNYCAAANAGYYVRRRARQKFDAGPSHLIAGMSR